MSLSKEQVENVCKRGQGKACCRYLIFGQGFQCAKLTSFKDMIDGRVNIMVAQSDNCEGVDNYEN